MPWYMPSLSPISEYVKKRLCIYLLQRYLGQFIEEKLTLDQLSLDVYNGTGIVRNVRLDVQALNDMGEKQNWPVEFVDGYLEQLYVSVPWTALLSDSTNLEVTGLKITVQPKQRQDSATSVFETMWSSVSSSMQLAKDYMTQEPIVVDNSRPLEGIEKFAQTIDSVLTRIRISFIDTIIQMEHVPKDSLTGVAIEIRIGMFDYLDEACSEPSTVAEPHPQGQSKTYTTLCYTTKRLYLDNVTFHTVEFPSVGRTFNRFVVIHQHQGEIALDAMPTKKDMDSIDKLISSHDNVGDTTERPKLQGHISRHEVIFGKLMGKQEIRVRLKNVENISGSKVSMEVTLGGLVIFLTPRQVYILLDVFNGITRPHIEDNSNVPPKQECKEKPMTCLDYQRIEQDLQDQVQPIAGTTGLQGVFGWSTRNSDTDDVFHPMLNNTTLGGDISSLMNDSAVSHTGSSMEASFSSSMASSVTELTHSRRPNTIENDPSAEITQFEIRIASLSIVVLHDDILSVTCDSKSHAAHLVYSSVVLLKRTAEDFFNALSGYNFGAYGLYQFEDSKQFFEEACRLNHIRLIAAPIQIDGRESTMQAAISITGKLTIAKLELLECLYNDCSEIMGSCFDMSGKKSNKKSNVQYIPLLYFVDDSNDTPSVATNNFRLKPAVKLSFKYEEKFSWTALKKDVYIPKTELSLTLDTFYVELDITIVNRISALLNGAPVCFSENPSSNIWATYKSSGVENSYEFQSQLNINSADITIKLRFPVPDLRPNHDMNRRPWWQREVRADYLTICMYDASGEITYTSTLLTQKYAIHWKRAIILYNEAEDCVPISLGNITSTTDSDSKQQWPSFEIEFRPEVSSGIEIVPDDDPVIQSTYPELKFGNSGPFSSTRVVHESDTPHAKLHQDDSEQLIIPGDRSEMTAFITETSAKSRIAIKMNLPTIYVDIASKHLYEVLYNRINSDLMLWESSAPEPQCLHSNAPITSQYYDDFAIHRDSFDGKGSDWFGMCKSGIQYDSDSDTSTPGDFSPESDSIFESIYEPNPKSLDFSSTPHRFLKGNQLRTTNNNPKQSVFTLNIVIGNGKVNLWPPVRDTNPSMAVLPNHKAELLFVVEKGASIFSVSGYAGDANLSYICLQINDIQLHHCDLIELTDTAVPADKFSEKIYAQLHPTIHQSDPGILSACKDDNRKSDMISMAVKIQASHETHYVKIVKVALGINKATLKHRMCSFPNTWFTQLIDFFNVMDYTIPGYVAKDVVTELHIHLWNCSIDYRPINLNVRSFVTMESFSASSHLSPKSNTSTLRFIAQECKLHLSDHLSTAKESIGTPHQGDTIIHLVRDYVPVVEIRLFELSLRTNDKKSGINPHINLRASNNIMYIYTCSDSGKALIELMTYFAQDGDLATNSKPEDLLYTSTVTYDPLQKSDTKGHPVTSMQIINSPAEVVHSHPQNVSKLSRSQYQHVNDMLGDAMKDCVASAKEAGADVDRGGIDHGAQIFFFPDEGILIPEIGIPPTLITTDLGDITFRRNRSSDTDDEFCIIGENTSAGKMIQCISAPEIHWLTNYNFIIIDNYFTLPMGKTDVLKRPKSCPIPIMEYTLREMTIVWHIYGGYDFGNTAPINTDTSTSGKRLNFNEHKSKSKELGSVVFTNTITGDILLPERNLLQEQSKDGDGKVKDCSTNAVHRARGGSGRNTDVLIELQLSKVRFLHEVYPEDSLQASRQVLAISDVEIRDRLKSSNINKFLYQYTSEAKPRQSHSHMIIIKAAHIRPNKKLKTVECSLKVSLLPLRLNIDQDTLSFLVTFFNELSGDKSTADCRTSSQNTPTHHPPVMTVSNNTDIELKKQAHRIVGENLLILLEEDNNISHYLKSNMDNKEAESGSTIYFRSLIFHPEVPIRLDYTGKHVDMFHGSLSGLLMGLGQLNCSELRLKNLSYRHGLLGLEKLVSYCLQEWLMEIKRHQIPSLLGGVGPMHSLIILAQGIIDLVRLPIEQYQKDGRIVRGLQRGATSFTTSTAMAALELTSRLIHLIQITAETAYDMMSPGPSVRRRRQHISRHGGERRHRQPEDIRAGAVMAYNVFKEGIEETALNIIRNASHEHDHKGVSGVVGGILRQIPPNVIVKPIILASEATNNLLGGVQNQLVPDAKREANEKWKGDDR